MRYLTRHVLLGLADYAVTIPLLRWTWTGPTNDDVLGGLDDFRPVDRETASDMVAGRYVLASKFVDTQGISPFAVEVDHDEWLDELHAFSWLRHFRDARTDEDRRFARTLTLDWIGRHGGFDRETWAPSVCARRVLNWLRHYNVITEGASDEQARSIARSLGTQVQSLRLRGPLTADPVDALLVAIAVAGAALCEERRFREIGGRLRTVRRLVDRQIDTDGLHRSRNPRTQLLLLVELISLNQAVLRYHDQHAGALADVAERMHRGLDGLMLGTGETAYFNGAGQLAHDLLVAVQAQNAGRLRGSVAFGGYGRLASGEAVLVADSGLVPPVEFAASAHAGALAFEMSYGNELVTGNCGPAPVGMEGAALRFREGLAHDAPTIDGVSAAAIRRFGPLAGRLAARGGAPKLVVDAADDTLTVRTQGFADRFGVAVERQLTLLGNGRSLVGQDRFIAADKKVSGTCTTRFHLAPGAEVLPADDLVRIRLASGAMFVFLWEGASLAIDESIRQSAHYGSHRTKQIVLAAPVSETLEVSWIFTLEDS